MLANGYGRIVNVASVAGKEGNPNASAYSASKAGVIGLTKSLGKELATKGVIANALTPATFESPILEQLPPEPGRLHALQDPDGPAGRGRGERGDGLLHGERGMQLHHRRRPSTRRAAGPPSDRESRATTERRARLGEDKRDQDEEMAPCPSSMRMCISGI
jgi:NAD(P)-dependent dehydrogenase (short-subunit alcohol dehydrogenase family)